VPPEPKFGAELPSVMGGLCSAGVSPAFFRVSARKLQFTLRQAQTHVERKRRSVYNRGTARRGV